LPPTSPLYPKIRFAFTDHPITVWIGAILLRLYVELIELRAVRDLIFLAGADLIPHARQLRVRFAVPAEERPEFLQRLRTLFHGLPIAAQLDWDLSEADDAHQPSPGHAGTTLPTVRPSPHAHGASP
jgi:hypothetical protein